jgi:inner membrane protein
MKTPSAWTKYLALGGVMLLMVLALNQIDWLVDERADRLREAEASVETSLAGRQTVLGPFVVSQCREEWPTEVVDGSTRRNKLESRDFTLTATPQQLAMKTQVAMEPRHRSLFKINTYVARSTLVAQWSPNDLMTPKPSRTDARVVCDTPRLAVALSDPRGIRQAQVKWAGDTLAVASGTGVSRQPRGFHAVLPAAARSGEGALQAEVVLDLVGTADFSVVPIGDDNRITMEADWPHPSFGGRFLPLTREVRDNGFTAQWQVSSLATSAAADFQRGACGDKDCIDAFRVSFIDPVNPYSLSDRATKYGMLFVGLTFLAIWMVELLWQLRVHPLQYLFVGSAVSIFFLLLLSLSEHLSFGLSYGIAAAACATLLGSYGRYLLRGVGAGIAFGVGVATLYGALYLLLQLENTALVVGSVMLFLILAALMTATRKVDWHRLLQARPAAGLAPTP